MRFSAQPELVVADASPIHYLVLIQAVDILPKIFGRIVIPAIVANIELQNPKTPEIVRAWISHLPAWAEVKSPLRTESLGLDAGEEQAIALALELKAPVLLDEKDARMIAKNKGLRFIGTIGVLERAAALNFLDLSASLTQLRQAGFFISDAIIQASIANRRLR